MLTPTQSCTFIKAYMTFKGGSFTAVEAYIRFFFFFLLIFSLQVFQVYFFRNGFKLDFIFHKAVFQCLCNLISLYKVLSEFAILIIVCPTLTLIMFVFIGSVCEHCIHSKSNEDP